MGKAEEIISEFYQSNSKEKSNTIKAGETDNLVDSQMMTPDVIVVDPPRKGCDNLCLDTMLKMSPSKIVYVSCDSATLARDLRYLCDGGYQLKKVCPVDQFAQTVHVETVVGLQKVN